MLRFLKLITLSIFLVSPYFCYGQNTTVTAPQKPSPVKHNSSIKISAADGELLGHDYVDLGLPSGTLWATCNIGANTPTELGDQYAWGEITPKSAYTEENSLWQGKECDDIGGHPEFDAATANWGEHWRMPSHEQIMELDEKCKWVYTKKNGTRGFIIIGPNGKNIFLPSRMSKSEWTYGTYQCEYWSSTPNKRDHTFIDDYSSARGTNSNNKRLVYGITSSDESAWICSTSKYYGHCVRPVYCDSIYEQNPNFIRPEGRTYVGKASVWRIPAGWLSPSYAQIPSKDSGSISVTVIFDQEGVATRVSMKSFGPVSKNKEICDAVEKEIRSKKMIYHERSKPIPNESKAQIRYEFR